MDKLQEIKERWAKGTPGPWKGVDTPDFMEINPGRLALVGSCIEDGEKIAHAPQDIADLVEMVETLKGRVSALRWMNRDLRRSDPSYDGD